MARETDALAQRIDDHHTRITEIEARLAQLAGDVAQRRQRSAVAAQKSATARAAEDRQILLPFAEKEYIDVNRAAAILGISYMAVFNLYQAGEIEFVDYNPHSRKRVKYSSVVALCDRLRKQYAIEDRRPDKASHLRHRDCDLLPFPLDDTIYIPDAQDILGYTTRDPVMRLISRRCFDAYKLAGAWRISRSSTAAYLAKVQEPQRLSPRRGADLHLSGSSRP